MRAFEKWTIVIAMFGTLMLTSGCASYLSYQYSKDEIFKNRIYASGNKDAIRSVEMGATPENAIRAVPMGNNGVGIVVDLAAWDILTQHPLRQLGAAILDAGMMYGTYQGVKSIDNHSSNSSSDSSGTSINLQNSNDNSINVVNGNGNGGNQNPTSGGDGTVGNGGGVSTHTHTNAKR